MNDQDLNQNKADGGGKLIISSRRKWLWLGILVSAVNPIFAGLIMGAVYLSEPELRKEGLIVSAIAILWGAVLFYWVNKNMAVNLFSF